LRHAESMPPISPSMAAPLPAVASPAEKWLLRASAIGAAVSLIVGAAVLTGWWLDVPRLVRPIPSLPGMVPNSAEWFVLLATSLFLLRRQPVSVTRRGVSAVCALAVVALAAATLAEYIWNLGLGVDQAFFHTALNVGSGFPPGRCAPGSAAAFALLASALLWLDAPPAVRIDLSEQLAVGAGLIALLAIAGYVYGAIALYGAPVPHTGIAPHEAGALLALSLAVLCARPDRPLIAVVASRRAGGFVVRRLLAGAPAILGLGFVVTAGLRGSLYGEPFAAALLAVAAMTIGVALALSTARALNRIDELRSASERALAEREERLRDFIEKASDGVFIADLDGRYTQVNDAGCRMLGYSREEIIGKKISDFLPADEVPRLQAARSELLRGVPQVDEWRAKRRDGTYLPVEVSAKILPNGLWQALVRDISARKELERATEAVTEAVASTPQSSVHTVLHTIAMEAQLVADAEYVALGMTGGGDAPFDPWVFVGLSPERAAMLGRPPRPVGLLGLVAAEDHIVRVADIRRHPAFRGFPPHHPQMTSFLGVPIHRHGQAVGYIFLANKRGAPEFTVADERAVERLAANAGTAIETARLYQAEGLERAWLQAMIDQMPEGVILVDATGATRAESRSMRAYARDTGQRDQFGQPVKYELFTPTARPVPVDDQPQTRAVLNGVTTMRRELLLRHSTGRMVPMLVSAAPVFDQQGKQSGAVTIFQDVSALKELERLRKEWASVVAHDLRQPLGVIAIDAEAIARMLEEGQFERCSKIINRIRRSAQHLNKMIDDLVDVSRIEARRLKLDRVETDLAAWLDDVVDRLSLLADGHPVRLEKTIASAAACVDAGRIEQVLGNLASNAAKYGEPGAEIGVRLSRRGEEFEFAVTNRGPGILPEELPRLFERFSRSEARRRKGVPGLGLGLYICRGLVEAHGGRLWAESVLGETTTFFFTIPSLSHEDLAEEHADMVPV
jgi:PAS domain S-box-containing protein